MALLTIPIALQLEPHATVRWDVVVLSQALHGDSALQPHLCLEACGEALQGPVAVAVVQLALDCEKTDLLPPDGNRSLQVRRADADHPHRVKSALRLASLQHDEAPLDQSQSLAVQALRVRVSPVLHPRIV